MAYWLVKSEPEAYSFTDLLRDARTSWDGVRNYQARNNLSAMQPGDLAVVYHSVSEKAAVGLAKVTKAAYPDPTAKEGAWVSVELAADKPLNKPVSLAQIKSTPSLANMGLLRQSRLSVTPLTADEFAAILALSGE